jgi:TolB-like protein/Tfp pilus assembly protein PilF
MGEQNVKNIARPVRAYAMSASAVASTPLVAAEAQPRPARRSLSPQRVVIAASTVAVIAMGIAAWWAWPNRDSPTVSIQAPSATGPQSVPTLASTPAPRLSIVVLPFVNLSNDPEQEYFADGITDDLTADLSRISDSFVIARNTAFTYKGIAVDVKQVGRELGVRYILEGSVRRAGDQVQVNVQLIDAESGAHIWADRYETDRRNLAETQATITGRLARTLNLELIKDAGRRIEQERAVAPDARDLIMRGWALWYRPRSLESVQEAQRAFEQALEIDPRSIDARIGLAKMLLARVNQGWSSSFQQDLARAEQLLLEALERDTDLSTAHLTIGVLRRDQNRLTESRFEFERAVALDPNDSFAHIQLGWTRLFMGDPAAALAEGEIALRLSPHDPQLWGYYVQLGWCPLLSNQVDPAIELLIKSRAENQRVWLTHFGLAAALGLKGDLDAARTALAELRKANPKVDSLARVRELRPWGNSQYWALYEKTAAYGMRRAGFPEE